MTDSDFIVEGLAIENSKPCDVRHFTVFGGSMNRLSKRCMFTDIKKVIEAVKADKKANATVTNDIRVNDVSIYVARNENVDYWATLSLNKPIRGMYTVKNGDAVEYRKGLTSTVTVPLGTLITLLFDALLSVDSKDKVNLGNGVEKSLSYVAKKLGALKDAIVGDAHLEATTPGYTSHFHELIVGTTINVITRDVFKADGKVKSLFSLNEREHEIDRDSVWADIYGLVGLDDDFLVDAYNFAVDANAKKATADAAASNQNAVLTALQKAFAGNSAAGAINAALG